MDASARLKKYRRTKQNNEEGINGRGRTLSDLPDNVLSHIVSFLSTKEAVRTSILSKRWEFIWTSIPKLNFDEEMLKPKDLVNIIERALRLRGSFNITNFSLYYVLDKSHVEAWISSIVRFNIQNLELDLAYDDESLTLPLSFVNCRTLTSFTLNMLGMLEFPSSIGFPNLKKLELYLVTFPNEHSTQQLFSSCPILEDLKLQQCDWSNVKTVSVTSPRLQFFTMLECHTDDRDGNEFVVHGGGLKSFHYDGEFYFNYSILNSELLEVVHINSSSDKNHSILIFYRLLSLLKCASKVPNLTLGNALVLLDIPELVFDIPMFTGVRYLDLGYQSSDLSNVGLLKILGNIPCLESLHFSKGIKKPSVPIEDGILDPMPPCFLSHLGFIFVHMGEDAENLEGVKVLLKSAMVLVEMAIGFSELVTEDKRNKFYMELMKLPKGSKDSCIYVKE